MSNNSSYHKIWDINHLLETFVEKLLFAVTDKHIPDIEFQCISDFLAGTGIGQIFNAIDLQSSVFFAHIGNEENVPSLLIGGDMPFNAPDGLAVDPAVLNRWEQGKVRPHQSSMAKIAVFRSMGKKELAQRIAKVEEEIWN